jgi:chromosome partitioning protein
LFDRDAAEHCWALLRSHPRVQSGRLQVAAVGMRVDGRTNAESKLRAWAAELGLPFLGALRQTQTYTQCSEQGLTVFDLPEAKTQVDRAQWQAVLAWLAPAFVRPESDSSLLPAPVQAAAPRCAAVKSTSMQPAVWQELAAALSPETRPTRAASGRWWQKIGRLFGSPAAADYSTVFQPSQMAA